jgi:signal peptidase I
VTVGVLRSGFAWARSAASWAVVGVSIGVLCATILPLPFGGRSLTVMSGSMEPTISTGDVILAWPISPLDAKVGDVVTYREHGGKSRLITHRVRRIRIANGTVRFVTKGDSNTTVERWSMPEDATLGRVAFRLPKLGYPLSRLGDPRGRLLLIVLALVSLAGVALARIWRTPAAAGVGEAVAPLQPAVPHVPAEDVRLAGLLRALSLAGELGVTAACRAMGVHRSSYYRLKRGLERGRGPALERLVVGFALAHPGLGPRRISAELARDVWGGFAISPSGVWRVLDRHRLNTSAVRSAVSSEWVPAT